MPLALATFEHVALGPAGSSPSLNSQVDLTGLTDLQGQVEFRLYALSNLAAYPGAGTIDPGGSYRVGNYSEGRDMFLFSISGSMSAIPEPSSMIFLTVSSAVAGIGVCRRRFRGASQS